MAKQFSGRTYEADLSSQQNMEALLDALGVTDPARRDATLKTKARVTLTVDGDKWTETTQLGDTKTNNTFKLGEEFEETTPGASSKAKSIITLKGDDTFVHKRQYANGKTLIMEKKLTKDKVFVTVTVDNVTAKINYVAV